MRFRTLHRRVARNTDARMMIASLDPGLPAGDKAPVLTTGVVHRDAFLIAVLDSFVFDALLRNRCGSTNIDRTSLEAMPLPVTTCPQAGHIGTLAIDLGGPATLFSQHRFRADASSGAWRSFWRLQHSRRLAGRAVLDAVVACLFGLSRDDLSYLLSACDAPLGVILARDPKGFWRIDKDREPELRHTVLTLVAFADLQDKVRVAGGNLEEGLMAFLFQNDGEGWMLPETLRLADYGLGHDERAKHPQPVASRLGARFYDWQLAQTAEESWRECEIHAKNLGAATTMAPLTNGFGKTVDTSRVHHALTTVGRAAGSGRERTPWPESTVVFRGRRRWVDPMAQGR